MPERRINTAPFIKVLRRVFSICIAVGVVAFVVPQAFAAEVTIGHQRVYDPWINAIATGQFERATGIDIEWRAFESSLETLGALARGDIQIAHAGGTGLAGAASVGVDFQIFWVLHDINAAEALVVRKGSDIEGPQDLRGKRIAVPIGSTAHYHLLFALEQFNIGLDQIVLVRRDPQEMLRDWDDGLIDAAFVWDPILSEIEKTGKVLLRSSQLRGWGRPTFAALAVNPAWAAENPGFMTDFVGAIAAADNAYRRNPGAWTRESAEIRNIAQIVGGAPKAAVDALRLYAYPSMREQTSRTWLGGGSLGGVARALLDNARFLNENGQLKTVRSGYVDFVTDEWIRRTLAGRLHRN